MRRCVVAVLLAALGRAQTCFFSYGGVYMMTDLALYTDAISLCRSSTSVRPLTSTSSTTVLVTDPTTTSVTVSTTVVTTGFLTATGDIANSFGLPVTYVLGNCVLNDLAGSGVSTTVAWIGPPTVSLSTGPNSLITSYCSALRAVRTAGTAGYTGTLTSVDCNASSLPVLCALTARVTSDVTVTEFSFVRVTATQVLTTATVTTAVTVVFTTEFASTTTTTRQSVSIAGTFTITVPTFTASETITEVPLTTVATTSTFTFLDTSFVVVTVSGTETVTLTSTFTRYTTTVSNLSTDTFCSVRLPVDE